MSKHTVFRDFRVEVFGRIPLNKLYVKHRPSFVLQTYQLDVDLVVKMQIGWF